MTAAHEIIRAWCASCGMPAPSNGECIALEAALSSEAKRDKFAEAAMNGICSHADTWGLVTGEKIALAAYEIADAMLKVRRL